MESRLAITVMYVVLGLLMSGLSVPLILNRVKPNPWYGFRVPKTLSDPDIWYKANHYAGVRLFAAGLVCAAGAAAVYALLPSLSLDIFSYTVLGIGLLALGGAVAASFIYLNSL